MATITIKNIPDKLYELLKASAKTNRRSINNEIIICIEERVSHRRGRRDVKKILDEAREVRKFTEGKPISHEKFDAAKNMGRL
ncbi:MAG: DNA-binding protein [Chloroflexota bacterium]